MALSIFNFPMEGKMNNKPFWLIFLIFTSFAFFKSGCGGGKLRSFFPENRDCDFQTVVEKLSSATKEPAVNASPVIAVVLNEGKRISLLDLRTGKTLWDRNDIEVSSAPYIAPYGVFFKSGNKIIALSIENGKTLWKKTIQEKYLYGFAFDDRTVFVTSGNTNGGSPTTGRKGIIRALNRQNGGVLWKIEAEKMLGAPAATGGMVFVPWDRQAISVLDSQKGREIFRFIRKDGTVDFVLAQSGTVFYGSASDIVKLSKESIINQKMQKNIIKFNSSDMPGSPRIFPDVYMESSYAGGAKARNRLLWSISQEKGDEIKLNQDKIYFIYYRYVIAFDAKNSKPVWIYMSNTQIASSATTSEGILLLTTDGALTFVDGLTGSSKILWKENILPQNAFLETSGFTEPKLEKSETDVHRGLVDMILDIDTQVIPLRKFGMKLLSTMEDEKVTMDLVQIMSSAEIPKTLRDEAAQLLRMRKGGTKFLIDALKSHADYLENRLPPPVGAIASSLAESNDKKSVNLLLEHLLDPQTPSEDLAELSAAIIKLGNKENYEPLKKFFLMYHADSSMKQNVDVMVNIARAILKFGGENGRKVIETVAGDSKTPESLRIQLSEILKEKTQNPEEKGKEEAK